MSKSGAPTQGWVEGRLVACFVGEPLPFFNERAHDVTVQINKQKPNKLGPPQGTS